MKNFSYQNIEDSYDIIRNKVLRTPLISIDYINNLLESKVFFKCENLQKNWII